MWPFKKREKRPNPNPMPNWLKWALIVFVGYALLMSTLPGSRTKPNQAHKAAEKIKTTIAQQDFYNFEGYTQKIFPERSAQLEVKTIQEGDGTPTVCGQEVSIAYQAYLAQGTEINDRATAEKPLKFRVGDGNVMPVFDKGVEGMKRGEKRSIFSPPLMAYGLERYRREDVPAMAAPRFEIELLSATPELPSAEASPFRTLETMAGNGIVIGCGDTVDAEVTLWSVEGKKLYSSAEAKQPIHLTLGASEVMIGLEHGIIGMRQGGTRLLIIPPSFQNTMKGNPPKFILPLPKSETVMVEVEAISR